MTHNSEQATIEARIDWDCNDCRHRQRQHFANINFWRDIFPGSLSQTLPASDGEWVNEEFAAGALVEPYSESNIHRVRRTALKLQRKHGPPVEIVAGRSYPRYLAAGVAGINKGNVQPMHILDMDADFVHIDLNHPLARIPLTVAARIRERTGIANEHGGRCNDIVQDMLATGMGLQGPQENAATAFFNGVPFARMDARDDNLFYASARLVQHLDTTALTQIKAIYAGFLQPGMQVLDLMSSWDSHLPDALEGLSVTGLGMNAEELAHNPQLAEAVVHDLNMHPRLPFDDNRFDAVICTASVEYLVEPVAVMR
ncbi:MAG: methyltransferase domain-containing protein, partial [Gammaproteobacteria bacterium]